MRAFKQIQKMNATTRLPEQFVKLGLFAQESIDIFGLKQGIETHRLPGRRKDQAISGGLQQGHLGVNDEIGKNGQVVFYDTIILCDQKRVNRFHMPVNAPGSQ